MDKVLTGIKQTELRPCSLCRVAVSHAGHPIFYRASLEVCGLNIAAIRRQAGLELMLGGNVRLANAMGPDEDMAKVIERKSEIWICVPCLMEGRLADLLAILGHT